MLQFRHTFISAYTDKIMWITTYDWLFKRKPVIRNYTRRVDLYSFRCQSNCLRMEARICVTLTECVCTNCLLFINFSDKRTTATLTNTREWKQNQKEKRKKKLANEVKKTHVCKSECAYTILNGMASHFVCSGATFHLIWQWRHWR